MGSVVAYSDNQVESTIVNIAFKHPYDVLLKIQNKDDFESMRRGRDSNPRYPLGHSAFRERPIQPLSHPSKWFFSLGRSSL